MKVGCCGFGMARASYFARFPLVEVQRTFYQPPRLQTLRGWRDEAPPAFELTLKAWQVITHPATSPTYRRLGERVEGETGFFRGNETVAAAWRRTSDAAAALGARIVLFQCPASFTPTPEHIGAMRAFFASVDRGGLAFAWEPRGAWPAALVAELCSELGLVHALDPFKVAPVRGAYFRLHGVTGYRYRYTDDDLRRLGDLCREHEASYCLFNNRAMVDDATRFLRLLGGDEP